ncbi:hypothetical protein AAVH_40511, partial [Aphelenchoides avenae]
MVDGTEWDNCCGFYTNWAPGEDNRNFEKCAEMRADGKWADILCDFEDHDHHFIMCEKADIMESSATLITTEYERVSYDSKYYRINDNADDHAYDNRAYDHVDDNRAYDYADDNRAYDHVDDNRAYDYADGNRAYDHVDDNRAYDY